MSNEFRMPDIVEGLTEAEILNWFVEVGDTIEVETAKTAVASTVAPGGDGFLFRSE